MRPVTDKLTASSEKTSGLPEQIDHGLDANPEDHQEQHDNREGPNDRVANAKHSDPVQRRATRAGAALRVLRRLIRILVHAHDSNRRRGRCEQQPNTNRPSERRNRRRVGSSVGMSTVDLAIGQCFMELLHAGVCGSCAIKPQLTKLRQTFKVR